MQHLSTEYLTLQWLKTPKCVGKAERWPSFSLQEVFSKLQAGVRLCSHISAQLGMSRKAKLCQHNHAKRCKTLSIRISLVTPPTYGNWLVLVKYRDVLTRTAWKHCGTINTSTIREFSYFVIDTGTASTCPVNRRSNKIAATWNLLSAIRLVFKVGAISDHYTAPTRYFPCCTCTYSSSFELFTDKSDSQYIIPIIMANKVTQGVLYNDLKKPRPVYKRVVYVVLMNFEESITTHSTINGS